MAEAMAVEGDMEISTAVRTRSVHRDRFTDGSPLDLPARKGLPIDIDRHHLALYLYTTSAHSWGTNQNCFQWENLFVGWNTRATI